MLTLFPTVPPLPQPLPVHVHPLCPVWHALRPSHMNASDSVSALGRRLLRSFHRRPAAPGSRSAGQADRRTGGASLAAQCPCRPKAGRHPPSPTGVRAPPRPRGAERFGSIIPLLPASPRPHLPLPLHPRTHGRTDPRTHRLAQAPMHNTTPASSAAAHRHRLPHHAGPRDATPRRAPSRNHQGQ
jgi:hypothetical protein